MAKWTPTRAQFFALGLPAEACSAPVRSLAAVYPTDDTFELAGHGLSTGDLVRFTATGGGLGETPALPAPLTGGTLYEAVPVGGDLFQVRTVGGSVVNLTTAGTGVIGVVPDYLPKLDVMLEARARWVDDHCIPYTPPADTPPTGWPPTSLVLAACKLAALDFASNVRSASPSYSIDDVKAAADKAQAFLDELRKGKPLAVQPVDATPAVAEMGSKGFSRRPSRGFKRDSL
jgi:hypothetical protein